MRSLVTMSLVIALVPAATFAASADLVTVSTHVAFPTANPGGANEGTCTITNTSSENVRVKLEARVVFSDGSVSRLSRISDPGTLAPGNGFELNVFFVIPQDAALGTAQFVCEVTAQSKGLRDAETQTASFEVVSGG